ncbi:hypothetical protein WJX72_011624 [[Myrmecia] bisecta]|uniref:Uncharacterized protein n=1 Tax=[Myrmecia] bisecta TaxID=41462 RepID=A0AAW1PJ43_9CHLO
MVLVMAVHLPICATIIALKLLRPAWFKRHRGQFVALARFSRMAFVVVAHSVDAEEHVSGCSWGSRIYQVFIKESLGFCFLTNMMECGLLVAHLSGIPIVLALLSVSVPWACAPAPVLSFCTLRVASLLILVGSLVPALYLARLEYRMRKAFIRKEQARLHCKQD